MAEQFSTLNDGARIPFLAFGTGTILYITDLTKAAVGNAIEKGIFHFESAQLYENDSENTLGFAITASGIPRESLYITAKLKRLSEGQTPKELLLESLNKLKIGYVDLALVRADYEKDSDGLKRVWKGMEEIKQAGLAMSIGISDAGIPEMELILKIATLFPAVHQIELHPYCYQVAAPIHEFNKKHGILTATYSNSTPIVRAGSSPLDLLLASISERLEKSYGKEVAEGHILERWLFQRGTLFFTTTLNNGCVEEYLSASTTPNLTDDEMKSIEITGSEHFNQAWGKLRPVAFIQQLPGELLIAILEYIQSTSQSPGRTSSTITFTHVCRYWRTIAINTPTLWTEIDLHAHFTGSLHIASLYLERSKPCLIDITLQVRTNLLAGSDAVPLELVINKHLEPDVRRRRSMRIMGDSDAVMSRICRALEDIWACQLQVLEISRCRFSDDIDRRAIDHLLDCSVFGTCGAPKLHSIRLSGLPSVSQPAFINIQNLTIILHDVGFTRRADLKEMLAHVSHSLTYFRLEITFARKASVTPRVNLPALTTLEVVHSPILPEISAPRLERLSIRYCDDHDSQQDLFQISSFPKLSSLVISQLQSLHVRPNAKFFLRHPLLASVAFIQCTEKLERAVLGVLSGPFGGTLLPHLQYLALLPLPSTLEWSSNWALVQGVLADRIAQQSQNIKFICVPDSSASDAMKTWLGEQNIMLEVVNAHHDVAHPIFAQEVRETQWQKDVERFELGEVPVVRAGTHGRYEDGQHEYDSDGDEEGSEGSGDSGGGYPSECCDWSDLPSDDD